MYLTALILSFWYSHTHQKQSPKLTISTLTLTHAIPPSTLSFSPSSPLSETCPAFTAVTHTYRTTIKTTLAPRHCPSFNTRIDAPAPWSSCTFNAANCIRPLCLLLSTMTQPCITDRCCTRTATDTVYAPCPTACPRGCATSWIVVGSCADPVSVSTTSLTTPMTMPKPTPMETATAW